MTKATILGLAFAIGIPAGRVVAQAPVTAAQIVARIGEHTGVTLPSTTIDTFKSGDPNAQVRGIAVTMMTTLDVLKRAVAKGDNFIITHEPTFYSSHDTLVFLEAENDAVFAEKRKYIADHGLIIWRFHDAPHRMQPDMIRAGVIHALGWDNKKQDPDGQFFYLGATTTLRELAATARKRLGANAVRIIGDPDARVSTVGLTEGFPGFVANRHVVQVHHPDAMLIGEDLEWEMIEYATDAIEEGKLKGMIVVGHIPSEQAGMEQATRWLETFISEVPIHFIPTRDPFHPEHRN